MDLPKPKHPNEIEAMFVQMRNDGQFYIPQIGQPPLSIHDWKRRELQRWEEHMDDELSKL